MPKVAQVSAGKPKITGAVYRAALGTTLPTDATTELAAEFKELGFVSEDGITNTPGMDTETVYAWGGTPVLTTQKEKTDEWKMTFIESLNSEVLKAAYGDDNVTASDKTITVKASTAELESSVYVIDVLLKGGALKRVVIPVGTITEIGDIVYKGDEAIGYELTISAMDDGTGNSHYEYINLA